MTTVPITQELVRRVLKVVDVGLIEGLGSPVPGYLCVEAAVNLAMGLPHSDSPPCVAPVVRAFKIRLNDCPNWGDAKTRARGLRRLAVAQLGSADTFHYHEEYTFAHRLKHLSVAKIASQVLDQIAERHPNTIQQQVLRDTAEKCRQCSLRDMEIIQTAHAAKQVMVNALFSLEAPDQTGFFHDGCDALVAVHRACTESDNRAASTLVASSASIAARLLSRQQLRSAVVGFLSALAEDVVRILVELKTPGSRWLSITEEGEQQ